MTRIILSLLFIASFSRGQETGYDIMTRALNQATIESMQADLKLILTSSTGHQRVREIKFFSKTDPETDLTKMLMRFVYPKDVQGTGFLTLENARRPDDRFLYMPALRQVKKIASSGSGGNFMSSDFTYYDMGSPKLEDWTYQLLREDTLNGEAAYVIECLPKTPQVKKDTGYGKIIRWVVKKDLRIPYAEYYDRFSKLEKTMTVKTFENIKGLPFATDMIMEDVQINHRSEMIFQNLKIDLPVKDSFFTPRMLQRGR